MHTPALRAIPTLKETLTVDDYADACNALELDPIRTLRNPVAALPLVASCEMSAARRFLSIALRRTSVVDLAAFDSEDAARLFVSAIFVHFIDRVRRQTRRVQGAGDYQELCTG